VNASSNSRMNLLRSSCTRQSSAQDAASPRSTPTQAIDGRNTSCTQGSHAHDLLLVTVLVLSLKLGDLGVDLFHIETLHSLQHLLQGLSGKGTGLIEDQDTLAEGHQGRNALDAQLAGQLVVGVGIQLGEDNPVVLL